MLSHVPFCAASNSSDNSGAACQPFWESRRGVWGAYNDDGRAQASLEGPGNGTICWDHHDRWLTPLAFHPTLPHIFILTAEEGRLCRSCIHQDEKRKQPPLAAQAAGCWLQSTALPARGSDWPGRVCGRCRHPRDRSGPFSAASTRSPFRGWQHTPPQR